MRSSKESVTNPATSIPGGRRESAEREPTMADLARALAPEIGRAVVPDVPPPPRPEDVGLLLAGATLVVVGLMMWVQAATPSESPSAHTIDVTRFGFERSGTGRLLVTAVRVSRPDGERTAALGHIRRARQNALDAVRACLGRPQAPDIELRLAGMRGESAGLMLSLAVIDQLEQGDVSAGRTISGTGTITAEGEVGRVLQVIDKAAAADEAGADIFFVPSAQAAQAEAATAETRVVAVRTLDDALRALTGADCHARFRSGRG